MDMDKPENTPREGEDETEASSEEFHYAMEDVDAANTGRNPAF